MLPDGEKIMVAHRTINIENLDRLLELKPGIEAIVVGSSGETAQLAIGIINGFGFTHLKLTPYYPQMPAAVDLHIKTAVTMGLSHLVPEHVATIICNVMAPREVATRRHLPPYLAKSAPGNMIMSGQMMVSWLGEQRRDPALIRAAGDVKGGVESVLSAMQAVTPDLGGTASTEKMGEAICEAIEAL